MEMPLIVNVHALQAHTCDNILELPNYQESLLAVHGQPVDGTNEDLRERLKSIIHDRLKLAVTCCNSYGLDEKQT